MEPLNLWSGTSDYLYIIYNALLIILPGLIGLVLATEGGRLLVSRVRALYAVARPTFDEPSDPLVVLIAAKSGRTPEEVTAFLTSNLDPVIALFPEQKKNLTEGIKAP